MNWLTTTCRRGCEFWEIRRQGVDRTVSDCEGLWPMRAFSGRRSNDFD